MNPSYFRIKISKEEAIKRLSDWWETPEPLQFDEIDSSDAVEEACNSDGTIPASEWRRSF